MRKEWSEHQRLLRREIALLRCDLINHSICHPEKRVELNDLLPGRTMSANRVSHYE
jgi:hypothetical protein